MTTCHQPHNDSLHAWFHEIYLPSECPWTTGSNLKHWRQAIDWFSGYLRRTPLRTDLNEGNLTGAMLWMLAEGYSPPTVEILAQKLCALWRFLKLKGVVTASAPFPRPSAAAGGKVIRHKPKPEKKRRPKRPHKWMTPAIERMDQAPMILPAKMTPETPLEVLAEVYRQRRLLNANPATAGQIRAAVKLLDTLLGRPATIADLRPEYIEAVVSGIVKSGRSLSTAVSIRKKLCALWNYAFRKGALDEGPDLPRMKAPRRVAFAWTRDQMLTIFEAISRDTRRVGQHAFSDWLTALLLTIWDTGERLGALLQIQWSDLDASGGRLLIRAEYRKWKTEDKSFVLHPLTMEAMTRLHRGGGNVFPWTESRSTLNHWYRQILKAAGMPHGREQMFHSWRRSVASHYKAAGADATRLLGHSDPTITEAYLSPEIVKVTQPSTLLFRPNLRLIAEKGGEA